MGSAHGGKGGGGRRFGDLNGDGKVSLLEAYVTYDLVTGDGPTGEKKPANDPPTNSAGLASSKMGCLGWVLLAVFDVVVIVGLLVCCIAPT